MHPHHNRYIEVEDPTIVLPDIDDENMWLIFLQPSDEISSLIIIILYK